MVVVMLSVAGVAAIALGLFGSPGLTAIGALWLVVAYLGRRHALRLRTVQREAVTNRMMLEGAAVLLVGGVAALLVGLNQWGIDDPDLRWLPIVVGGALTAFAVLTGSLFLLGSGLQAAAGEPPTVPATITIVSAADTGTMINDRPRMQLVLDVAPEGQPTYRVTKKATVPFSALGSIRPGDGFRAKVVGPDEPEKMDIDWATPILGE